MEHQYYVDPIDPKPAQEYQHMIEWLKSVLYVPYNYNRSLILPSSKSAKGT